MEYHGCEFGLKVEQYKYQKAKEVDVIKQITLTEDELQAAIYEGKKKKYFHEKNKDKWPPDPYENKKQ